MVLHWCEVGAMTRVSRTRTSSETCTGEVHEYINETLNGSVTYTRTNTSTISDFHGRPVVPSGLSSTQVKGFLKLTGEARGSYYPSRSTVFYGVPVPISAGSLITTPLQAPSGWFLDVIARTNPSRPGITPLELLQDLIDLPKMLRDAGNLIGRPKSGMSSKEVANHYLCAQFGWVPLIDDLKQLLDFQNNVLKRTNELKRLYAAGGLRRRIAFKDDHQSGKGEYRYSMPGAGCYVVANYNIDVIRRSWATIRWKPVNPPDHTPSDVYMNTVARQAVSGLTVEGMAKGLWQVLPWTWLIGWFTNVGKYALLYSNTVPASHSEACFMSESRRIYVANGVASIGLLKNGVVHTGAASTTEKTRIVSGSVTPGFSMPFLDMFRLSILGALFTQRLK